MRKRQLKKRLAELEERIRVLEGIAHPVRIIQAPQLDEARMAEIRQAIEETHRHQPIMVTNP